ncbi:MAG TPA: hypothetical protein VMV61_00200 [Patescibacteria group bacterium]|nr:hypothetical protein [Patescibacteria group bacterium]
MNITHIQLHDPVAVEAMAPTPRTVLERLRGLLSAGVQATPDVNRPNFFTLIDNNLSIYFYISPVSAKVWVLESRLAKPTSAECFAAAQTA